VIFFLVVELQEEIHKLTQGKSLVTQFYTTLRIIWEEIDNFLPLLACKCSIPCSCRAIAFAQKYKQQDQSFDFLKD